MYTKCKKSLLRNRKAYISNKEAALQNSLSGSCLCKIIGNWAGKTMIEILENYFSNAFDSLLATGGRTKSSVIDRDKRLRRKRNSKLDTYMDSLSLVKNKSTMRIPSSCLRESCDSTVITPEAGSAKTLLIISEIDRFQCCEIKQKIE